METIERTRPSKLLIKYLTFNREQYLKKKEKRQKRYNPKEPKVLNR